MAESEFECRNCKTVFTLFMRVSDRLGATVACPGCGNQEVDALM